MVWFGCIIYIIFFIITEQRDSPKPGSGYASPAGQRDSPKPGSGYASPAGQRDSPKPGSGYASPAGQRDSPKPGSGYASPAGQRDSPKPASGHASPAGQRDSQKPGSGYASPAVHSDSPKPGSHRDSPVGQTDDKPFTPPADEEIQNVMKQNTYEEENGVQSYDHRNTPSPEDDIMGRVSVGPPVMPEGALGRKFGAPPPPPAPQSSDMAPYDTQADQESHIPIPPPMPQSDAKETQNEKEYLNALVGGVKQILISHLLDFDL